MTDHADKPVKTIQVLNRAFGILVLLAEHPERPLPLREIVAHTGLNMATCANILKTMVLQGFVEQISPKKGYLLGPMAYYLTRKGPYRKDLVAVAEPEMKAFGRETGETVVLSTLQRGKRFVLCRVDGTHVLQVADDLLFRDDIYDTATGRMLLAHLPASELEAFVTTHGLPGADWPEVTSLASLHRALARIKETRLEIHQPHPDAVNVAVPVYEGGQLDAALGLHMPAVRFTGDYRQTLIAGLQALAQAISEKLA